MLGIYETQEEGCDVRGYVNGDGTGLWESSEGGAETPLSLQLPRASEMKAKCIAVIAKLTCMTEMSYIRDACVVSRWDEKSNQNVYEGFGIDVKAKKQIVQWLTYDTLI